MTTLQSQAQPESGNDALRGPLWLLNTLVHIRVSAQDGADGISVLEHSAPYGDSPPLHLHNNEDEIFHVLAGELRLLVGGEEQRIGPGDTRLAPKGVAHTYRVVSAGGARMLTITNRGDFERFVRRMSRPAEAAGLPEPAQPHAAAIEQLAAVAAEHGIDIVGPPLD